jgi:hypothetical protein
MQTSNSEISMKKLLIIGVAAVSAFAPLAATAQEAVRPIETTQSTQNGLGDSRTGLIVAGATAAAAILVIALDDGDSDGPPSTTPAQ